MAHWPVNDEHQSYGWGTGQAVQAEKRIFGGLTFNDRFWPETDMAPARL